MAIPPLTRESVERALEMLTDQLPEITGGPHGSTVYDLLWEGERYPPKVIVSKAVEIQYGRKFPESEFSGGEGPGQANSVLRNLGFQVISKAESEVALSLKLHGRYGRKAIYATQGVPYDQQQQHLNLGLSPRCRDGGYMIFVTLNKDELDPSHDYPDDLSADHLLWVSRRDVTIDRQ